MLKTLWLVALLVWLVAPAFPQPVHNGHWANSGEIVWKDHGADSTITGFSSISTRTISYKVVGNVGCVVYFIAGTSNAITFSFTLPFSTPSIGIRTFSAARGKDNGTFLVAPAMTRVEVDSNVVDVFKDWGSANWTNTGEKVARGQFLVQIQP